MTYGIKCPPPILPKNNAPRFQRIVDLQTPAPAQPAGFRMLRDWDSSVADAYQQLGRVGYAQRPAPLRNWEYMDQRFPRWSREAFADSLINDPDVLHRDHYTAEEHLEAFDLTEKMHQWARMNNAGYQKEKGIYLYSADMGAGKSLSMAAVAWAAWCFQGIPIYSNMSLRFGYKISGAEIYSIMELAEPGSIIILDEVAALLDSFSFNSTRSRSLTQALTAFRKRHVLLLAGTANEAGVLSEIRRQAEGIICPEKVIPPARAAYPAFCYIRHRGLAEPWAGTRVVTDARRLEFTRGRDKKPVNPYAGKWLGYINPAPGICDIAARVSDTLDRVPAGDSFDITRDSMMQERQRIRAGGLPVRDDGAAAAAETIEDVQTAPSAESFLDWWLPSRSFKPKAAALTWAEIKECAAALGVELLQSEIKAAIAARGIKPGYRRISVTELRQWQKAGSAAAGVDTGEGGG